MLGTTFLLRKPSETRVRRLLETSFDALCTVPWSTVSEHLAQSISMHDVAFRWRLHPVTAIVRALRDSFQRRMLQRMARRLLLRTTDCMFVSSRLDNDDLHEHTFNAEHVSETLADVMRRDLVSEDAEARGAFSASTTAGEGCPLINMSAQQELLERSVLFAMRRERCQGKGDADAVSLHDAPPPCTGVIIHGPSGTGKTALAEWLVGQSQMPFVSVSCADLVHKAVGDSERAIANIFQAGRRSAPCFLVLDNIEMIVGSRPKDRGESHGNRRGRTSHAALDRVLSTLLAEMDGLAGKKVKKAVEGKGRMHSHHSSAGAVIVIATTSDITSIDR